MKYARLSPENIVIEVVVPPAGVAITDCFTPELAAQFEECPMDVEPGWIKLPDGSYVSPDLSAV